MTTSHPPRVNGTQYQNATVEHRPAGQRTPDFVSANQSHRLDPRFDALRRHLHRGGAYGFWAYESEARKSDNPRHAIERRSVWFPVDHPAPLPPEQGPHGFRHFWFGVHPTTAIPPTNPKGEARAPQFVRSQVPSIAAINCLYAEYDGHHFTGGKAGALAHLTALALPPSVVIDSGGGYHCYWLLADAWILSSEADRQKASTIQHAWVPAVGGDPGAKNLNRVLRVPGTHNYKAKYGPDYPLVEIIQFDLARLYGLDDLLAVLPPEALSVTPHYAEAPQDTHLDDAARASLYLGMLAPSRCEEYDSWLEVGMALTPLGAIGLALWERWSKESPKYQPGACAEKWATFSATGLGLGSLAMWARADSPIHYAEQFPTTFPTTFPTQPAASEEQAEKESQADTLLRIGEVAEYYRSPGGELYARVPVRRHHEIYALSEKGSGFRRWLTYKHYAETGKAPNSNALTAATGVFTARAQFEAEKREVFVRIGYHGNAVYLDLCNDNWEVIEITPEGWQIIKNPPILFRRSRGMLPLPRPQPGGSINDLHRILNLGTSGTEEGDRNLRLVAGWLIGSLAPHGPYAHLNFVGQAGTAKSTATRTVRNLIDPNEASARAMPKEPRDLAIAAKNSWVVAYDNLSHVPDWLSDDLCRLATGQASATRALYTDDEEVIFNAKRPAVFNGIGEVATRGDLLARLMVVKLPVVEKRLQEREHTRLVEALTPGLLGALCDGVVTALRNVHQLQLANLPRLADFAQWVEAAAPAFGWAPGAFLADFAQNQDDAIATEIEASPLAGALITWFQQGGGIEVRITPTELHEALGELVAPSPPAGSSAARAPFPKRWPGNARALSSALTRLAPALRTRGIWADDTRTHGIRFVVLKPYTPPTGDATGDVPPLAGDAMGDAPPLAGDAMGDANAASGDATGDATLLAGDANEARVTQNLPEPPLAPPVFPAESTTFATSGDAGDAKFRSLSARQSEEEGDQESEVVQEDDAGNVASPASLAAPTRADPAPSTRGADPVMQMKNRAHLENVRMFLARGTHEKAREQFAQMTAGPEYDQAATLLARHERRQKS
jgi:hypothetical protein